jgi:hypothetical protein
MPAPRLRLSLDASYRPPARRLDGAGLAVLACLEEGTPAARNTLSYLAARWNRLSDQQRGELFMRADALAAEWRDAVLEKGSFIEVGTNRSGS